VSTSNCSTYQSVKLTNGQLMDELTLSLFKITTTNLVTFQTVGKKIKFPNPTY
jgi:hypothetical protein